MARKTFSFTKTFKEAWADDNNVYYDPDFMDKVTQCRKETSKVRSTAWFIPLAVAYFLNKDPNQPVTYQMIASLNKNTSIKVVKRAHELLIRLGVNPQ